MATKTRRSNDMRTRKLNWAVDGTDVTDMIVASYYLPVSRNKIRRTLQRRSVDACVTLLSHDLVGVFASCLVDDTRVLEIIEFIVHPDSCGRGVGRWQMQQLKARLGGGCHTLRYDVYERDQQAISFLSHCGFRASLMRDAAPCGGDIYRMEFRDS